MPPIIVAFIAFPFPLALGAAIIKVKSPTECANAEIMVVGATVALVVVTVVAFDALAAQCLEGRVRRRTRRATGPFN